MPMSSTRQASDTAELATQNVNSNKALRLEIDKTRNVIHYFDQNFLTFESVEANVSALTSTIF